MAAGYGEILRKKRLERRLSIADVRKGTNIDGSLIAALEEENIGAFPSESYFLGFLANYCEFLGLSFASIKKLYVEEKMRNAPPPPAEPARRRPAFLVPLIIALAVCALLGGGLAYFYFGVLRAPEKEEEDARQEEEAASPAQYQFDGAPLVRRLYKGDQILIPASQGEGNTVLTVSGTLGTLTILTPAGSQIIELSEERELDIDGDGAADIIIYLSDISNTNEENGAEIRLFAATPSTPAPAQEIESSNPDIVSSDAVPNSDTMTVIHEDTRAYPFTIIVSFREPCLFRYQSDSEEYVQNYYRSGEIASVTSSNRTRIWVSNFGAIRINVSAGLSSYDLSAGREGEVQAEDIRWVRERDGTYRIVVLELD